MYINRVTILAALGVVALLGIGYVVYRYFSNSTSLYNANRESMQNGQSSSTKTANMMLFYADWCPHCTKAKPEWNSLKDEYNGKVINGYKVSFTEYDCSSSSSENAQIASKYDVNGFPTFKIVKDNQVISFDLDGPPTKASLENFLNSTLYG